VHHAEAVDHDRVKHICSNIWVDLAVDKITLGEFRVGEREYDRQDRTGDELDRQVRNSFARTSSPWSITYLHDNGPGVWNIPVLANADDDVEVSNKLESGVESNPPEAADEVVVAEEARRGYTRSLAEEHRGYARDKEDGEPNACSNTG
jgi:hypothetical protein